MADTVFRYQQAQTPTKEVSLIKGDTKSTHDTVIEPPFTDYEKVHNHPFTVDYFELGNMWNQDGIYNKEVNTIEKYLKNCINKGHVNDLNVVKDTMKKLEKTAGVEETDRTIVRVGKLATYVTFLLKTDNIKY